MNTRILSIIRKEFIQVKRDPRSLAIILVVPALQLLMFGYAVTTNVDHIATVVFNQAMDGRSRDFLRAFTNTEYFTVVGNVSSHDEARDAIDRGMPKWLSSFRPASPATWTPASRPTSRPSSTAPIPTWQALRSSPRPA